MLETQWTSTPPWQASPLRQCSKIPFLGNARELYSAHVLQVDTGGLLERRGEFFVPHVLDSCAMMA